jgi:hypothetical protein
MKPSIPPSKALSTQPSKGAASISPSVPKSGAPTAAPVDAVSEESDAPTAAPSMDPSIPPSPVNAPTTAAPVGIITPETDAPTESPVDIVTPETPAPGDTFQVTWDFIPNAPLDVKVGDTAVFIWLSELHDVYIHPTLDGTETGAIAIYAPATRGGSPTYTFTAQDASPGGHDMFFASDIRSHCDANTNLAVKVFLADATAPESGAPTAAPVDVVTSSPIDVPTTAAPVDIVTPETDAPT